MNGTNNSCCVCLNNFLGLNKLSKKDDSNITLFSKLKLNVPQVEWEVNHQICEPCTNLLNIVHTFRETCLKSDIIRKSQLRDYPQAKEEIKLEEKKIYSEDTEYSEQKPLEEDVEDEYDDDDDDDEDDEYDDSNDPSYSEEDEKKVEVKVKFEIISDTRSSTSSKRKRNVLQFQCEKCTNHYNSSTILVRHCVEEHGMKRKDVRPFVCNRCNNRFGNSSNLLQHIKYHEAVRSNMCTYCGKGFITKTDLNIHEKQHLNMREYKCDTCVKSFNTHKDLRSHKLVVHTDPQLWKYFCEMCNKPFPIKSNYDCHMRRHTGDKKFHCHLCDKKFTDKCVLQRHMRTHSNVRDFKCSECDKEYKDKRVMQIHMAKIHGIGVGEIKLPSRERKYICHMCPKAYYARNKLTRHLYTHTGEKPFFCNICNKKFNDKSYVKQHIKKTHNIGGENVR